MYLFDLGVTRKFIVTWVRGPLLTRLHKNLVDVISSRLQIFSEFIPREFARQTRSLKFIDQFKATEFGLMNSGVGPVVLSVIYPIVYLIFSLYSTLLSVFFLLLPIALSTTIMQNNCRTYVLKDVKIFMVRLFSLSMYII